MATETKATKLPKAIRGFPIYKHYPEIKGNMDCLNPMIISAPTGTGKTTMMVVDRALNNSNKTAFIGVPTIAAVRSIEKYCRELIGDTDKQVIGNACGGFINYTDKHRVVVCTHRHLFNKLATYLQRAIFKKETDIFNDQWVMLDETHEKNMENYMLVAMALYIMEQGYKIKICLSSATLDSAPLLREFKDAKTVSVEAKRYPVEIKYHYEIQEEDTKVIMEDTIDLVASLISTTKPGKTILIFLSGEQQIYQICSRFDDMQQVVALPLHSTLEHDEIQAVFDDYPDEVKIVASTNIGENAITIPGVVTIIDTMREKAPVVKNHRILTLREDYISKASATQRTGRAGRTEPGTCYRMCSKIHFEGMRSHSENEFNTMPKEIPIMELMDRGLPADKIFKLDKKEYGEITARLTKQELIKEGKVTALGRSVIGYPVSLQGGLSIHHATSIKCAKCARTMCPSCEASTILTILVVSMYEGMGGNAPFWFPRDKRNGHAMQDYRDDKFSDFRGRDDIETNLNIFLNMIYGSGELTERAYSSWAKNNSMNNKHLSSARKLFRQLIMKFYSVDYYKVDAMIFTKRLAKSMIFSHPNSKTTVCIDETVLDTVRRTLLKGFSERFRNAFGEVYELADVADAKDAIEFNIHYRDSFCTMFGGDSVPATIGALNMMEFEVRNRIRRSLSWTVKDPDAPKPRERFGLW